MSRRRSASGEGWSAFAFEARKDETVDGILRARRRPSTAGRRGPLRWNEGPERLPGRALRDPGAKQFDLRGGEPRLAGGGRRHAFGIVGRRDAAKHFRLEPASAILKIKPEPSLAIGCIRPMAGETVI